MKFLKRFALAFLAIAFCLSVSVITADAQRRNGNRNWNNRQNNNRNWQQNNRRSRNRSWQNRRYVTQRYVYPQYTYRRVYPQNNYYSYQRYGRITPQEYRRQQRQRSRIYNTQSRYYSNDGYISNKERRKLQKRYYKYRRSVYRDRRDW